MKEDKLLTPTTKNVFAAEKNYQEFAGMVQAEAIHALNITNTNKIHPGNTSRFSRFRNIEKMAGQYNDREFSL